MKALLFAAGLGTRLKEHTQDRPKALVSLAGKPLLQHAIEHLKTFGITDITVNVFHFAEQVISYIEENKSFGIDIHISDERDQLLDTGGGLKKAGIFLKGERPHSDLQCRCYQQSRFEYVLLKYHLEQKTLATLVGQV